MNKINELDYQLYIQRENEFFHQPNENENSFYRLIADGNVDAIRENQIKYGKESNNPGNGKGSLSDSPLRNEIYHLVVNAALIARACISGGMQSEIAYTLSDMYIRRADKCNTVNAVKKLNDEMVLDYAQRMKNTATAGRVSPAVRKAAEYIIANLGQKLSGKIIADSLGYNRSYLHTLFKNEMGKGIHEYITGMRIKAAKSMLTSTDMSAAQISQSLGFCSQSHFCKTFNECVGYTPVQYRKFKRNF